MFIKRWLIRLLYGRKNEVMFVVEQATSMFDRAKSMLDTATLESQSLLDKNQKRIDELSIENSKLESTMARNERISQKLKDLLD